MVTSAFTFTSIKVFDLTCFKVELKTFQTFVRAILFANDVNVVVGAEEDM